MNFKLSIIIPTYDSLDTLKVLIKNILDYTDGDYIVYVIEDGQKRETIDWLKTQKVKTILHKENKGVAPSWNDGLREAKKDECSHFAIFNDDIELPQNWWLECKKKFKNDVHLITLKTKRLKIAGWFFILDKHCIDKIGFFDEQFANFCCEDDDYIIRYEKVGLKKDFADIKVFHHGSKTINKLDKKYVDKIYQRNFKRLKNKYENNTCNTN